MAHLAGCGTKEVARQPVMNQLRLVWLCPERKHGIQISSLLELLAKESYSCQENTEAIVIGSCLDFTHKTR